MPFLTAANLLTTSAVAVAAAAASLQVRWAAIAAATTAMVTQRNCGNRAYALRENAQLKYGSSELETVRIGISGYSNHIVKKIGFV